MNVRRATDDDVPALRALINAAYRPLGDLGLNFTGVDQDEATTRRRMHGREVWVIEDDKELVATVTVSGGRPDDGAPYLYLGQLAVDPSHQRRGLGSRLMALAEERARELGLPRVRLDTAIPATELRRWYEARGYHATGEVQHPGKTYRSVVLEKST